MKCRALIIEDDLRLADAIVSYLELNNIICDHCSDGAQGIHLIQHNTYDVLVTDIHMPRMSGTEMCQTLRDAGNELPVIMITSLSDLSDKIEGFNAGTDDYLVKPFELKELLLRIQALSKRKSTQATLIDISELRLVINISLREVKREGKTIKLSKSSWALLELLARAWPNPVSKADMEHALWGDEPPDSNGLKVHIHHLRQRIDKPFNSSLVQAVHGFGFVLNEKT